MTTEDSDMPCGIDEVNADKKNLDRLGQEMLDAYLEEAPVDQSSDDEDDDSKSNKENFSTQQDREEFDTQASEKDDKKRDSTTQNSSSFSGDMKQFHEYLVDRLGNEKLDTVKNLIKKFGDMSNSEENDAEFKNQLESLLNDKERLT